MSSFAKKIKKNKSIVKETKEERAVKVSRARAKQIEDEVNQRTMWQIPKIANLAMAYANIYRTYVLKTVFHLTDKQLIAIARKIDVYSSAITTPKIKRDKMLNDKTLDDEIVNQIIRVKENNGCNYPEYQPLSFDCHVEMLKRQGKPIKQSALEVKLLECNEIIKRRVEIFTILALRDELGFAKKRIERYVTAWRKCWSCKINDVRKMIDELAKKKITFPEYRIEGNKLIVNEVKMVVE